MHCYILQLTLCGHLPMQDRHYSIEADLLTTQLQFGLPESGHLTGILQNT